MDSHKIESDKEINFVRQIFSSEAKYVVGIILFVFGIAKPYYDMKEDVALTRKDVSIILQELQDQKQEIAELQRQTILSSNK